MFIALWQVTQYQISCFARFYRADDVIFVQNLGTGQCGTVKDFFQSESGVFLTVVCHVHHVGHYQGGAGSYVRGQGKGYTSVFDLAPGKGSGFEKEIRIRTMGDAAAVLCDELDLALLQVDAVSQQRVCCE